MGDLMPETDQQKAQLRKEIETAITRRFWYSRFDFWLNQGLFFIAILASVLPAVNLAFEMVSTEERIALMAAIPGFVVLIQRTFKWGERGDWEWEFRRKLRAIQRQLIYDEDITPLAVSQALSNLEGEMDSKFPDMRPGLPQDNKTDKGSHDD